MIAHTPRERRIQRLIGRASTTRLCKISAKGGPISEWASEELDERGREEPHEDTPHLEHPFMDFVESERRG